MTADSDPYPASQLATRDVWLLRIVESLDGLLRTPGLYRVQFSTYDCRWETKMSRVVESTGYGNVRSSLLIYPVWGGNFMLSDDAISCQRQRGVSEMQRTSSRPPRIC